MTRRMSCLVLAALGLAALTGGPSAAQPQAGRAPSAALCSETPEPQRWTSPSSPDRGRADPILAVHRGAAEKAPENTLDAFRYALAYEVEMVEVDVQQTADHRFVAFHDLDVAKKTGGTGMFPLLTFEQARALNVANNAKWRDTEYNPTPMPSLEEVLALVAEHKAGVMFDLKESVTDTATVANMAAAHGLLDTSVFIPYVPGRAEMIKAAQPSARINFSNQAGDLPGGAPPGLLYPLTAEYWSFGSSLPAFDPGDIAEIHDGCGLVIPNVYQGHVTGSEAGDLAYALSIGADGAQVNNPDVAVDVLDQPVATRVLIDGERACLVNARNGLGLPGKTMHLAEGTATTGRGGCAALPSGVAGDVIFQGDGSALGSAASTGS